MYLKVVQCYIYESLQCTKLTFTRKTYYGHLLGEGTGQNSKLNPQIGVSAGGDVCRPSSDHDMLIPGKRCNISFPDLSTRKSPTAFISDENNARIFGNFLFFQKTSKQNWQAKLT